MLPPENEIQIWRFDLNTSDSPKAADRALLSAAERRRAGRFHFEKDSDWFIARRAALRRVLSRYLGIPPGTIRFTENRFGKPELSGRDSPDPPGLRFNLSHSEGFALIAVSRKIPVGIDIERMRPKRDLECIAREFFSVRENADLRALPEEIRLEAFYAAWTRKEAVLKAVGRGLSLGLDRFDVALAPGAPVRITASRTRQIDIGNLTLLELPIPPGFKAALAALAPSVSLRHMPRHSPREA